MSVEPCYAVIFTSKKRPESPGYEAMAEKMLLLSEGQDGFLGVQSARNPDGFGITVSYWTSLAAIRKWKENIEHQGAQKAGRDLWYSGYEVRICHVDHEYSFGERA